MKNLQLVLIFFFLFLMFSSVFAHENLEIMKVDNNKRITGPVKPSPNVMKQLTTKKKACAQNAKTNEEIDKLWYENDCGMKFKSSYQAYFNECMNGNPKNIKKELKQLTDCICKKYADTAVDQEERRILKGCPKKPVPSWWSSNYSHHYNWCVIGKNYTKAKYMNQKREQVLTTYKPVAKPPKVEKTVIKNDIITLYKKSDPGATFADVPYSGSIKAQKSAKLKKITNNTLYRLDFRSGFNNSLSAAACSTFGTTIKTKFILFPGQSKSFTLEDLAFGKFFYVCTDSNKESSLKLDYEYELTQ